MQVALERVLVQGVVIPKRARLGNLVVVVGCDLNQPVQDGEELRPSMGVASMQSANLLTSNGNDKVEDGGDVLSERTSPRKDDSDSFFSISDEDEESVGNTLSDNISEPVHTVSTNGSSRLRITSWQKGGKWGSGSFGTVYEGISNDGFFFAVKEVSLVDPGSQGKEKLLQLQQEISLLSQFDHKSIVRYLGSDKDDNNLYVFLELMTNGSLATLYHKYELRDSQVSKFTRQILNGLKYLHDQKVVHRDIKCANILVDASGSVKLADFGLAKMQALFRIGRGEPPLIPDSLSKNARDFILRCLQVNPNDRPSAAQLLDHPFVKKPSTSPSFDFNSVEQHMVISFLRGHP